MRAFVLILSLLATPALGQSLAETMTQTWLGEGEQPGFPNFQVILHLHDDGAVIDYPDLNCAGWWAYTAVDASSITGIEHLAAGFDRCEDLLTVRVEGDGALGMIVTWIDDKGAVVASARMSRL